MDRDQVLTWVAAYESAWRTPGTGALAGIFAPDATYRTDPYSDPVVGLPAIERFWERERAGPDEVFEMSSEVVAVDGNAGVVRVEVAYGPPINQEYRDLWILRLDGDGRCQEFEEWPFWPGKGRVASAA